MAGRVRGVQRQFNERRASRRRRRRPWRTHPQLPRSPLGAWSAGRPCGRRRGQRQRQRQRAAGRHAVGARHGEPGRPGGRSHAHAHPGRLLRAGDAHARGRRVDVHAGAHPGHERPARGTRRGRRAAGDTQHARGAAGAQWIARILSTRGL